MPLIIRKIASIIFIFYSLCCSAQKVGLVLSGGGASGISHVGVIKALEEHNIPIDYLCGTSMGGIVGAFYAAGISPDSIEKIFTSDEVNYALTGDFSTGDNYHYAKKDDNSSWFKLGVKLDSSFNVSFRPSLIKDYNLNFALAEFLGEASYRADYDFDSLYIPYRALASDIFTQKQVILRRGALNEAARVTSTVPLFYRPIKFNDQFLFDGGIYNNFPVDVMKDEFAPDIIIGVNVSSEKFNAYPYEDDERLINNFLVHMFVANSDTTGLNDGVYIEPNVDKFGATDFQDPQAIIDSGYIQTIRLMDEIKEKISKRVDSLSRAKKRFQFNKGKEKLHFRELKLEGFEKNQVKYLRRLFNKNDSLDFSSVKKNYYRLVAEEYFHDVFSTIHYNKQKEYYSFVLRAEPKAEINLLVGGNVASRNISNIYLGLDLTYLGKLLNNYHLDLYSGRFYQSAQLKARLKLPTKPSLYIEPIITLNNWDYLNTNDFLIVEDDKTILERVDRKFGVNFGIPSGTLSKIVIGGSYINNRDRFSNVDRLASSDTLDVLRMRGAKASFLYSRNSLNRKLYASEGSSLELNMNVLNLIGEYTPGSTSSQIKGNSKPYNWVNFKFRYEQYIKANWFRYGYLIQAAASTQPRLFNYRSTQLYAPAFYPIQDSRTIFLKNFRAYQFIAGGLRAVVTTKAKIDIRAEGYVFKPFKTIVEGVNQNVDFSQENLDFYLAGTLGAVYHSPIGPLSVSLNYYEEQEKELGLLVHFGYLLFNKRSEE